jgi:hypothetical protein
MKYYSRLKLWKAPNLTFNPETREAYSYGWYQLLAVINGNLVLNIYNYSNTTVKHVHKLRRLLNTLGIQIDVELEASQGLQNFDATNYNQKR